ncbi:Adenylate and Guanylate cyclase catalytic domain containing protein [Trichomonas vaginalis G3]|uniref:Adenylate and Guanylate cyclase catalytic domain containing protein n=1 Tax=Trichomonas vaginalis (strain ATCC PRA-98 / G3) TaxID=412133 RepID=A2EN44_TRIV3|nr:guanylate cyclase protein [Trichomonas vaginalis G3]EAY05952.1 Adenylate and Guanylate cyclase catalytic domain containing protein [Trichomonas vaginalis G3]KAI5530190.1 guanylate cyclase protein [Trichomonas vaginalis G3]|eukprot:XP_001318175.1 Adenylate and Guanylate cyclase catalytic domain containing protein [Trichomonas vaginalis G3]
MYPDNQAGQAIPNSASIDGTSQLYNIYSSDGYVDSHFPLWSQLFLEVKLPIEVVYPFMLVFFIQTLSVSLYIWTDYWQQEQNYEVQKWVRTIMFWRPIPNKDYYCLILAAIFFFINIAFLIIDTIQMSYYRIQRKFISALIYPLRIYFDTFLVTFIVPNLVNLGESFAMIANGNHSVAIVFAFILSIANEIYIYSSVKFIQSFAAISVNINVSPLLNFDSTFITRVMDCLHVSILMFFLVNLFEKWSYIVDIIIHVLWSLYSLIYLIKNMIFVDPFINGSSLGLFLSCFVADFSSIALYFYKDSRWYVVIGAILVSFGIFILASILFVYIRLKRIKQDLKAVYLNQDEYNYYYDELNLKYDEERALMYLRIGFTYNCPCFYNWSLVNYIEENFDSEKAISLCLFFANFFPKEFRLQNRLESRLLKSRKLHYLTRFLLYQVETVKSVRQSSDNTNAHLKLLEIRNQSRQCEMMTIEGLDDTKLDKTYFESLSTKCSRTKAMWREALINFPNNPRFCEEYCRYLVEAECNFPEAIKVKNRQSNIELGHTYSIDHCFRSMVAAFPNYLIEKIVDFEGRIIRDDQTIENDSSRGSFRDSSNNDNEYGSVETDLDNELEEYIAKNTIRKSRARLALHRLLETKLPFSIRFIKTLSILLSLFIVVLFLFGFIFSSVNVRHNVKNMNQLDYIANARYYSALSSISIMAEYMRLNGLFDKYLNGVEQIIQDLPDKVTPAVNFSGELQQPMLYFMHYAAENFTALMKMLSKEANVDTSIYPYLQPLFINNLDCYIYYLDTATYSAGSSQFVAALPNIFAQMFIYQRYLAGVSEEKMATLSYDPDAFEIANNFESLYKGSVFLFTNLSEFQQNKVSNLQVTFKNFAKSFPIITFVVMYFPPLILHLFTLRSERNLREILRSIDSTEKANAADAILINKKEDEIKFADNSNSSGLRIYLLLILNFLGICYVLIVLGGCFIMINVLQDLIKLNGWNDFACRRMALSAESLNTLIISIVLKDIHGTFPKTLTQHFINLASNVLDSLYEADQNLVSGTNTTEPCIDFDEELDSYNIYDGHLQNDTNKPYKYYYNASLHQQIGIYKSYASQILMDAESDNNNITISDAINALFISDYVMFDRLLVVTQRFLDLCQKQVTKMDIWFVMIELLALLVMICFLLTEFYYYHNRVKSFNGGLSILKRINPYTLLNNKNFSKMFLNDETDSPIEKLSLEGLIIKGANDAIFGTNVYGIVEVANNSVTSLLGYTPEQILGQNVTSVFAPEYIEQINAKLDQMRNRQSSSFFEGDFCVISDASKTIPVHLSIIGMKNGYNDNVNNFVLVLRNDEKLVMQMKQAEDEKKKSEKLLYQILPRDIVNQINRGENDISFNVSTCSIIFIDINKFSEYAANLTPSMIMTNLSFYFSVLDKTAAKYPLLTKIKLIGDIYMGASGLFPTEDMTNESHAEQTCLFALDVMYQMDEINKRLDTSLGIRVGINTGGPIIAGVLGTDKPLFDIIGDPINVASRLQSTSAVNHIHVSKETAELVKSMNFDVIPRGQTALKGKGTQQTFYISAPHYHFNSSSGSYIMTK